MKPEYRFTIDRSNLEGKQGILTPDKDGYYDNVLVGIFNVENQQGERYIFDKEISDMLTMGLGRSQMTRWLEKGKLIGEKEHPHISDFISKDRDLEMAKHLWTVRNGELLSSNIAMQIAGIDHREMPDRANGRRVYGVYVRMRPECSGLKASLSDPNSNTAFSLRSFIKRIFLQSELVRKCTNIFTYDWVTLNGIKNCEKFSCPGLESAGVQVTDRLIRDVNEIFEDDSLSLGAESSAGIITQVIKDSGAWREVPDLTHTLCLGRQLSGTKIYTG